jgi:hypothetical protein
VITSCRRPEVRGRHVERKIVHIGIRCARGVLGRRGTAGTRWSSRHQVVLEGRIR